VEHFSICIIVKNEEKRLEQCLSALLPLKEEIVVVDTGSTDCTKEIAHRYTECVYDFTWCNDFAAARNYAAGKASHDWLLYIDSDEYVTEFNKETLLQFDSQMPEGIGTILRQSYVGADSEHDIYSDCPERFFDRRLYHYTGAIHEQVTAYQACDYEQIGKLALTVEHDGYLGTPEEIQQKSMRNITLLKEVLKKDAHNAHTLLQLGQSYYRMKDYEQAFYYYNLAMQEPINYRSEGGRILACGWINCLNGLHRSEEALAILPHYDELSDYADFVLLMGHVYTNLGQYVKATAEYLKATRLSDYQKKGANTYLPFYHIGNLYHALGDNATASLMYQKCGNYPPALKALQEL
jgi:glycosyltransferase involved in cell wall biosynthesis